MDTVLRAIPYVVSGVIGAWLLLALVAYLMSRSALRTVVYDKVAHYAHLAPLEMSSQAFVPYGFLLGWLVEKRLHTDELRTIDASCTTQYRKGLLSPSLLYQRLDGVLTSDMVNARGNRFLRWYLGRGLRHNRYHQDYRAVFGTDALDHLSVSDTPANFAAIKAVLDQRWSSWRNESK